MCLVNSRESVQFYTAIITYLATITYIRVIKGRERGVVVSGYRSSVTEDWRLKPEALGSIPGSTTTALIIFH